MKWYIIAGEASGDLHASNLMKGLYAEDPGCDIRFWGGPLMDAVYKEHQNGEGLVRDYKDGAVIGFSQIILHFRKFASRFSDCCRDIKAWNPDAVILVDYPGFNFRVAEFAHKLGYKVFYYIAPKVWASRESRIKKLKAWVDRLFIVFPFEQDYFSRKGVNYIYKGNPLIDAVDASPALNESRTDFFSRTGLEDKPYIALLPGSRGGEIGFMMPVLVEFADRMRALPEYSSMHFIIAGAPSRSMEDYLPYLKGREDFIHVVFGEAYGILRHARAAVINSGTASLEACLIRTPQVVGYGAPKFNFTIAKHILKVDHISLGNLILDRKAFRELLQQYFSPENLVVEVRRLLEDEAYRSGMLADYDHIRDSLGSKGASAAVAESMIEELNKLKQTTVI